jgi:type I restriction enzyme S subunit
MNDWCLVRLGDLIGIKHGWPFEREFFSEVLTGQPIVVTIGNFRYTGGFRFDTTTNKEYRGKYPKEFELKPSDLLLVMTCQTEGGEILGIPGRIPNDGRMYLHNQRIGKVVIKDPNTVNPEFLYWLFLTREFNQALVATASGTKILHTAPSRIESFKFKLPPLPEQRAIARILGALDDKIELNRQMNATLEALARALFKSWFVDFDPVRARAAGRAPHGMDAAAAALFPDAFEDSALGEVPRGWGVGKLNEIASITMGQSPPGDTYNESGEGIPFYQGIRDYGFRFPTHRVFCTAPTRFAEKGDVLLSVRAPVGSLNVARERCAIGRGLAALRLRSQHGSFLYYLLKETKRGWEKFEAEGTVFGSVSKDDVHNFQVTIPAAVCINQYNKLVEPLDRQIELNEEQSQVLTMTRDALLPKLLSGEIRVGEAERIAEEAV